MSGKKDTRNDILEVADELLMRRGFSSFSYKHIAVALGMRNAAIHYHFPAKSDLGVALVQRHRQRFASWSATRDAETNSSIDRLKAFVDIRLFRQSGLEHVLSPESIVSADYEILPEPMQHEARALVQDTISWLSETLRSGLDSGELAFTGSPEDVALMLAAAMHGAPHLAQANSGYSSALMVNTLLELLQPEQTFGALKSAGGAVA